MKAMTPRFNKKFTILTILFLSWLLGNFNKAAIGVVAIPVTKEFDLMPHQMGLIMGSFFLTYAVMTLVGGVLADKIGHKRVLSAVMILWSGFTMLTAVSWNFLSLVTIRLLFGAAAGGFSPASSVAVAEIFPQKERGRAKSLLISATILGLGLGGLITSVIVAIFKWRYVFLLFGGLGLFLGISFYGVMHQQASGEVPSEAKTGEYSMKLIFRVRLVLKLGMISFGAGIANWGLMSWLPNYWVNFHGLSMMTMGAMTVIPAACMFIVMLMSGYMLDKYIVGYEKYFLLCGTLCVFFFIFKTMEASTVTQAIVYLSLTFAAMAVIISTVYVLPLKYLPKQMIGSATGFINFMQQLAGCISSAVMGFLITHHADSYSPIFAFVMVMILLSIVATLMINPNDLGEEGAPKIKNDY